MESGELKESELYCPKCGSLGSLNNTRIGSNYKYCRHCEQIIFLMFLPKGQLRANDLKDLPIREESSCAKGTCDY